MDHKIAETDDSDSCEITCSCGEIFNGYSWADVGARYDVHLEWAEES